MSEALKTKIEKTFKFQLNKNQYQDIKRLVYEIQRRESVDENIIIKDLEKDKLINKAGGRNKFFIIKQHLIKKRFPLTSKKEKIDTKTVFLTDLKISRSENKYPKYPFIPEMIFIEKSARNSYLVNRFLKKFPHVPTTELNYYGEYLQRNKFSASDLKKPFIFIVKEKWDFIRPCPCTKNHLGCNYWIFNLGFGCPYDCSYCFLQHYTNFPGIVLPANLDDFFDKFDNFYRKINSPLRIGTGEFCDSLALDHITGYAQKLVNFFAGKPVFFELKTKSNNINNLLESKASSNIVISWSLNPQTIIDHEEKGTSSIEQRLQAAKQIKEKGYSVAFHFDPIIYSENWQQLYKELIETLYRKLRGPFKWISLGTLRGTRKLKNISEQRFPQSNIFYGELLLAEDKKLRYPKFIRKEIYAQIIKLIRDHDRLSPVYLCMEDLLCWSIIDKNLTTTKKIENYLLKE